LRKLTLEQIQEDARRRGGRCLSDAYAGSLALLQWECAEGHRWAAPAHAIRQNHWCKKCADQRSRLPAERVVEIAAALGGRCLTAYTNTATKMEWSCASGHRWWARLDAVKQGRWCPQCRRIQPTFGSQYTPDANVPLTAEPATEE
jgi:hypothetical protein